MYTLATLQKEYTVWRMAVSKSHMAVPPGDTMEEGQGEQLDGGKPFKETCQFVWRRGGGPETGAMAKGLRKQGLKLDL